MGRMEASEGTIAGYFGLFVSLIAYGLVFALAAGFPFLSVL